MSTLTTSYLTTDQLNIPHQFYGVPVCWIGEDGDALAVTADRRRGLAAIHALARRECAAPARGEHDTRVTHARFQPYTGELHEDATWTATPCQPGDEGAIPVVLVRELADYQTHPFCSANVADGDDLASAATQGEIDELIEAVLYRLAYRHPHWPAKVLDEIKAEAKSLYLTEDLDIYNRLLTAAVHTTPKPSYLAERATEIVKNLRAHGFSDGAVNRQVLCLAEEVGEFVAAYRRWSGQARRSGTAEEMHAELADVVITAYVTAVEVGIDLDEVIDAKLQVIFSRGWRDTPLPQSNNDPALFCAATIPVALGGGDLICGEDALPGSAYCRLHHHPDLP